MYCVRCDQEIEPDEPYDTHHHDAATGPGCTNYSHKKCRWRSVHPRAGERT